MWATFLSNYKYFSCQSSCPLLLLDVCRNQYRRESTSVGGIEQRRNALFLNSFKGDLARVIWITLDVSEFFNIRIFSWYKALYSASWFYQSSSSMASCSFTHGVFLKTDSYVFINTWNTEFYIPLLFRQNESRYKIWKQSTNMEI